MSSQRRFLASLLLPHLSSLLSKVLRFRADHSLDTKLIVPQRCWPHVIVHSSHLGPQEPTFFLQKQLRGQSQMGTATGSAPSWRAPMGQLGRDEGETPWCSLQVRRAPVRWWADTHLRQQLCLHFSLLTLLFLFIVFKHCIYLFLERGEGREKERRGTLIGCLTHIQLGPGLQHRHVP